MGGVEFGLLGREFPLELLYLTARGRFGQRRRGRAPAVQFLFELFEPHGGGFSRGEVGGFDPTDGSIIQANLSEFAVDGQRFHTGSGRQGGQALALTVLLGVNAEHEFITDIGGRRRDPGCQQRQQQQGQAFHAAIPVCLSSGRTSRSRPRNRTKASIASKLPPRARIESRNRAAVAPSNTPASSNASNASAAR